MDRPLRIIIVGGGIGGLSAAIALRKSDRDIIVLEQSSLNREIGATISLQPNASKIVEQQWDLEGALQNRGSMVDEGFQVYNLTGELQMRIPLKTKDKYGSERVMLHRQDLHDALKERAISQNYPGRPATMHLSSRAVSCDCETGEVTLSDGQVLNADLIIGADGIKSNIRTSILAYEVPTLPTGHSAYRMVIPTDELMKQEEFAKIIDARSPFTTMVMGHDRRLIMGPARDGSIYSVVAMVPDERMNESSSNSSWQTQGNRETMLKTFEMFPEWTKKPLELAKDIGLWQLRDIDPLDTWYRGRAILIGDAAHAMLPTQGQGASQSIEDAEALGAFYADVKEGSLTAQEVEAINTTVFDCRYKRASLIQAYSRQTAKPATDPGSANIKLNPAQFMDYNCNYDGARSWYKQQQQAVLLRETETQEKAPVVQIPSVVAVDA